MPSAAGWLHSKNRLGALILAGLLATLSGCDSGEGYVVSFPPREANEPAAAGAAAVSGTVRFEGKDPVPARLTAPDAHCRREGHEIIDESYLIEDGKVANVLVWVKEGLGDGWVFPYEKTEYVIDQNLCVFVPHVAAVRAHQPIVFRNSDPIIHNVNCAGLETFVKSMTPKDKEVRYQFRKPDIGKRVTCDLHGNMIMYIHVLDHPYFAVTGEDGTFTLPPLPPGDYVLAAWHERMGERTRKISVKPDAAPSDADFTFTK